MLTVTDIAQGVIDRMKAIIPAMATAIIPDLDKPDQMTGQILQAKYPKGLFMVGHQESEGAQKTEYVIISVLCAAVTVAKVVKLGQAARIAINEHQINGATRFEFHRDDPIGNEAGIFVRNIQFRCGIPATPPRDTAGAIAALNL
ncbi:MAG TPA: hypothetical protein DCZ63_14800 [Geobacter sp.]|nr:hypothetical protein [Geobacter sp.]